MNSIYVFSGPCGCGKSTLSEAYARQLVEHGGRKQVYVIHGDDFHKGFMETAERVGDAYPGFLYWPDILKFNWEAMLNVARMALERQLDVVIDYVVEDELPLLKSLAENHRARLFYVVLTATEQVLCQRLTQRGSGELIDRSLFLKTKLNHLKENQHHLYNISGMTVEEEIRQLDMTQFEVQIS